MKLKTVKKCMVLLSFLAVLYGINLLVFVKTELGIETARKTAHDYLQETLHISAQQQEIYMSCSHSFRYGGLLQWREDFSALYSDGERVHVSLTIPGYFPFVVSGVEWLPAPI